jgi:hypothetical protein
MVRRQQAADHAIPPKLRSPGHAKFQRHVEAAFWAEIAQGLPAEGGRGGSRRVTGGRCTLVPQRWRHATV